MKLIQVNWRPLSPSKAHMRGRKKGNNCCSHVQCLSEMWNGWHKAPLQTIRPAKRMQVAHNDVRISHACTSHCTMHNAQQFATFFQKISKQMDDEWIDCGNCCACKSVVEVHVRSILVGSCKITSEPSVLVVLVSSHDAQVGSTIVQGNIDCRKGTSKWHWTCERSCKNWISQEFWLENWIRNQDCS